MDGRRISLAATTMAAFALATAVTTRADADFVAQWTDTWSYSNLAETRGPRGATNLFQFGPSGTAGDSLIHAPLSFQTSAQASATSVVDAIAGNPIFAHDRVSFSRTFTLQGAGFSFNWDLALTTFLSAGLLERSGSRLNPLATVEVFAEVLPGPILGGIRPGRLRDPLRFLASGTTDTNPTDFFGSDLQTATTKATDGSYTVNGYIDTFASVESSLFTNADAHSAFGPLFGGPFFVDVTASVPGPESAVLLVLGLGPIGVVHALRRRRPAGATPAGP